MKMEDIDDRAEVRRASVNSKECNLVSRDPTVAGQCEVHR